MKTNKTITFLLVLSTLMFLAASCSKPIEISMKTKSVETTNKSTVANRFKEPSQQGTTAVQSAIQLAEEHNKLSKEFFALKQKKQDLISENKQLKGRIAVLEPELKQAKQELNEANNLLIEMRIELNNWKTDILGFRSEMRDADIAQLETLQKILTVLGGEFREDSSVEENPGKTSSKNSEKRKLIEKLYTGKPND